jgi:hypothetical protein
VNLFLRHCFSFVWPGRLAVRLQTGLFTVTSKGLTRHRLAMSKPAPEYIRRRRPTFLILTLIRTAGNRIHPAARSRRTCDT